MKYFLSLFYLLCLTTAAQEPKRMTRTLSADNAVIIREAGAVIVPKNDKLIVDIILGNHEQQSTDVQKDDEVLMANGKKVKTVKDLQEQYENTKVGDEFKIGLKRGENLLMAKFTKKSAEELNKAGGTMVMRMEQKEGEEVLPALGLAFSTKDKQVVVNNVLPTAANNFKSFSPKAGDLIVSINGKATTDAESFVESYDALKEGDKVTIVFFRDGKESRETFSKPKPMGRMIINR
ncbi:MAG: PDZ domain-containing protein [Ignavibacteriales bacterium]|nr:PDZ domain-containing protein [Ignavibacteriales bacterium]